MNHPDEEMEIVAKVKALEHTMAPPSDLEDRVIARLKNEKLIRSGNTARSFLKVSLVAAAMAAIFCSGIVFHSWLTSLTIKVSMSEKTYMLFLREGAEFRQPRTESELRARVEAYRKWAVDLRKKGVPITGTKLRDEATLLNVSGLETQIGGYFLVDAATYQEAIAIAKSCPHLNYGGAIEVRPIHPV